MKKTLRFEFRIRRDTKKKLLNLSKINVRTMGDYLNLLIEYASKKKLKL